MIEIIKHPDTRFEIIETMLEKAFSELRGICMNESSIESELRFTQRLNMDAHEYSEHVRTGLIARLFGKDKGDIIHWYETVKEVKINKSGKERIVKGYSAKPENVSMELYKKLLVSKLKDTLGLVGFNLLELGRIFNEQTPPLLNSH